MYIRYVFSRFKENLTPGSAKWKTMVRALYNGKLDAREAGLAPVRDQVSGALGGKDVHVSVIEEGGNFDTGPSIPIK